MGRYVVRHGLVAILALIGCVYVRPAAAQVVQGVVVDDQNLSRVSIATVRLMQGDKVGQGTETDARGHFVISLPCG